MDLLTYALCKKLAKGGGAAFPILDEDTTDTNRRCVLGDGIAQWIFDGKPFVIRTIEGESTRRTYLIIPQYKTNPTTLSQTVHSVAIGDNGNIKIGSFRIANGLASGRWQDGSGNYGLEASGLNFGIPNIPSDQTEDLYLRRSSSGAYSWGTVPVPEPDVESLYVDTDFTNDQLVGTIVGAAKQLASGGHYDGYFTIPWDSEEGRSDFFGLLYIANLLDRIDGGKIPRILIGGTSAVPNFHSTTENDEVTAAGWTASWREIDISGTDPAFYDIIVSLEWVKQTTFSVYVSCDTKIASLLPLGS